MDIVPTIYLASNCDNQYILFYATLLRSIEINHKSSENIVSYLIGDEITDENKLKVQKSLKTNIIEIRWLSTKDFIPDGFTLPNDRSSFPISIYMNIFLPRSLPYEIKKVLYLDVDMVVLDDISTLYHIDLGENIIAAALDRVKVLGASWGGVLNYEELDLNPKAPYFNTGVMLIDTQKWRANEVTRAVINAIDDNQKYSFFADQYGLNVVFGKFPWLILPQKWNHISIEPMITKPSIIHYIAEKPIHENYKGLPEHSKVFFNYLSKTEFKDADKITAAQWKMKKLKIIFSKFYRRLFNDFQP
ncbi:MAG: glycosyltransferase [Pelobium sp.]